MKQVINRLSPPRDAEEVCGNCVQFQVEGGKGHCALRYLQVDASDMRCEEFDMRDEGDEKGDADGACGVG